jgi:hypothetical protein
MSSTGSNPRAPTASRATPEVSGDGQWLLLGLMVLIEAVFVFAFSQLVDQARNRRSAR